MSKRPDKKPKGTALVKTTSRGSTSTGLATRSTKDPGILDRGGAALSLGGTLAGALGASTPSAVVLGGLVVGLGIVAQVINSEAAKRHGQRMESDLRYFGTLLEEVRHEMGAKLDREDVVEVVSETAKDMATSSYSEQRRRLARVAANGLRLADADLGRVRFMEKAAATLDDDHVEALKWLDAKAPLSAAAVAETGMDLLEWHAARRRVLEGDLPEARVTELARFGFATSATEREKDLRVARQGSATIAGEGTKVTRTTEHQKAKITSLGREFLAWLAWGVQPPA